MIKSVEIKNFQSHPDTKIDFTDGLNVLTGSSRSGKSTIRRAIMWVITNRPSGNGIVSWWIKKDDKIKGETKVTITLDNGTIISRVKSDKLNAYIINDKVLEAVATGVPEEITEAFNMSDINMSGQFDAPFLISQSAGYVAQYLNGIVNLEDADYFQSEVESRRRKCVQETEVTNKKITELSKQVHTFDWLDTAEALIERIKKRSTKIQDKEAAFSKVQKLHDEYTTAQETVDKLSGVTLAGASLVDGIKNRLPVIASKKKQMEQITTAMSEFNKAKAIVDVPVAKMITLSDLIENRKDAIARSKISMQNIQRLFDSYQSALGEFTEITRELKKTQRELDLVEICPLCGNKRKDIGVSF